MLHREHEEIGAKYPWLARLDALAPIFRILFWPFQPWLRRTVSGRVGRVERLHGAAKYREAFELALESAPLCERPARMPFMPEDGRKQIALFRWWLFVANAARCARHLGADERRRVSELSASARGPGGRNQADVLDEMSRWTWQEGNEGGAIELAEQAIAADPTWPYAYITRAFYGLHSGRFDPLPLLVAAVRADPECRAPIESEFEKSPELLEALRSAVPPS